MAGETYSGGAGGQTINPAYLRAGLIKGQGAESAGVKPREPRPGVYRPSMARTTRRGFSGRNNKPLEIEINEFLGLSAKDRDGQDKTGIYDATERKRHRPPRSHRITAG